MKTVSFLDSQGNARVGVPAGEGLARPFEDAACDPPVLAERAIEIATYRPPVAPPNVFAIGDMMSLERLPGVGRKTANVVLNTAFGEPTIAVDTHIFRVSNRTGIAKGKTPIEVEKRLVRLTPDEFKKDAHHWLILHGRYVCKARKPLCGECPIIEWCEYKQKELQ